MAMREAWKPTDASNVSTQNSYFAYDSTSGREKRLRAFSAIGEYGLSWMHIFIPALEGMKGRQTHHELAALFTSKNCPLVDGEAVLAELGGLLRP